MKSIPALESLDSAPLGIYIIDSSWEFIFANQKATKLFQGFDIPSVVGQNFQKVIYSIRSESTADEIIARFQITMDTGAPFAVSNFGLDAESLSGSEYYDWQIQKIDLGDGESGIICYFTDVTPQVQTLKQLDYSRRQFIDLAEAMPQIVWTAAPDGQLDYTNQIAQRYMGATAEDLMGFGYSNYVHPDEVESVKSVWAQSIATGVPYQIQFRIRGADGIYRWFLSRAVPVRSEQGEIVKWFGTCTDIDYEKKATEQLEVRVEERTRELTNLNEEMQRLTTVISHETQEPINTMGSYLKLLAVRYQGRLGADADEFIDKCVTANSRLARMIDDLWNYASVSRPYIAQESVLLSECVADAQKELEHEFSVSEADLKVEDLPVVYGNKALLTMMFRNLLDNGIKYCRRVPKLSISAESNKEDWLISIKDNGLGIDQVRSNEAFQLYRRLTNVPDERSTGMGLAICKKIAEVHKGKISFVSSSEGTTFLVALPKI
jgi:PAS domain S-box-containing protein